MLFLPVVFAVYWAVAEHSKVRQWLLLLASFTFYMAWNPAPVVLILYLASCDFFIARFIEKAETRRGKKTWVIVSIVNSLSLLGVFKYADWITRSVVDGAAMFGVELVYKPLGLVLPVGLSFVAFQTLSYSIDVYKGEIPARKSWLELTLFISFFPQIVAGPIVRAADFLPQLDVRPTLDDKQGARAIFRIATGMFKKLVIADLLAANIVDRVFTQPDNYTGIEVAAAVFSYTAQIYYDFSAYSDIAIGCAALFGFHIKENFDKPYLSPNVFEFWRRWHTSLGTWLRDYLYFPLGGSRCSRWRTCWNLMVTMVLGGVWHGADWRFVVWGFVHGIVMCVHRWIWWIFGKPPPTRERNKLWVLLNILFTFTIVMEARIVFRSPDIANSWDMFVGQFRAPRFELLDYPAFDWGGVDAIWSSLNAYAEVTSQLAPNLTPLVLTVMVAATAGHLMSHKMYDRMIDLFCRTPVVVRALLLIGLSLVIKEIAAFEVQPFIYFQF
jgi:D-alanyl-lipoteichoic acid acyltransferase DltB (MBOAT superfamily)